MLTGIGTVMADDCLLTDRSGLPRSRPLLRIVLDSRLRLPLDSQMVRSAAGDVLVVGTSAAPAERRKALESRGVRVLILDGRDGRSDLRAAIEAVAQQQYLSVLIEAGAKVNWAALETGVADKVFFYYAPKILGGLESLSMAGGVGRRRRADAIRINRTELHRIAPDEFAVEGYIVKEG
jgi:diaminohydroxyphosphoribosylaminopyrimidine deaminase/5-amino-6-(5-phosphoribosylamino)uracil reductase